MSRLLKKPNNLASALDTNALLEEIRRWIKNQRLYASFFEAPTKQLKELEVTDHWLLSYGRHHEYESSTLRAVEDSWPDCAVQTSGSGVVGIEVTELVDENCVALNQRGTAVYRAWDDSDVLVEIQRILTVKDLKASGKSLYSKLILLIHTDELELQHRRLEPLLAGVSFAKPVNLAEVFLVLSYDPRFGECPVIPLRFDR